MLASVGLFASGWPAFITAHVLIVWASAIIGFGLIVVGLIVPEKLKSDSPVQSLGLAILLAGTIAGR